MVDKDWLKLTMQMDAVRKKDEQCSQSMNNQEQWVFCERIYCACAYGLSASPKYRSSVSFHFINHALLALHIYPIQCEDIYYFFNLYRAGTKLTNDFININFH